MVVDVETTGGSPASASLTEVAAARYRGGELLGTYQTFVRPDERIPPFITALTGISDAMVADAPRVGEMLPSFLEFVGGSVLVGHNLRFDLSFLDHALVSSGRDRLANRTVDTLALARRLVRDLVENCKLGTLAAIAPTPPPALAPGPDRRAGHRRPAPRPAGAGRLLRDPRSRGAARPAHAGGPSPGGQAPAHRATSPPARRLLVHRRRRTRALRGEGHRPASPGPVVLHLRPTTDDRAAAPPAPRRPPPGLPRSTDRRHHRGPTDPDVVATVQPRQGRFAGGDPRPSRRTDPTATHLRRRRRRRRWTPEQLAADPVELLAPVGPVGGELWPASSASRRPPRSGTRPSGSGSCSTGTDGRSRCGQPVGWCWQIEGEGGWCSNGASGSGASPGRAGRPPTGPGRAGRPSSIPSTYLPISTNRSGPSWPSGWRPTPARCGSSRSSPPSVWPCPPAGSPSWPNSALDWRRPVPRDPDPDEPRVGVAGPVGDDAESAA